MTTAIKSEPQWIADRSNRNTERESLYVFERRLYRTEDGRYFFREFGGAALAVDNRPDYIDRHEAVLWIAEEATDRNDIGYTREQAEQIADGINVDQPGTRHA